MIDSKLLNAEELTWLDNYHRKCLELVAPRLINDNRALKWLKKQTERVFHP